MGMPGGRLHHPRPSGIFEIMGNVAMKLSELSRRDYIAIEIVGHLVGATLHSPEDCAEQAYVFADAMLRKQEIHADMERSWERRAQQSDTALQVLRDTLKDMLGKKADENPAGTINALRSLFGVEL
jgi:hypothetical protein